MRHRKAGRKLKRTSSHRKATIIALATSLIRHKRIKTTVAKAKEARLFAEQLITRAKNAVAAEGDTKNVHARRMVGRYIKDRTVITELFGDVAQKVAARSGGYTRVIKLGQRQGDGAEVALLELVDYNTGQETPKQTTKQKPKKEPRSKKTKTKPEESAPEFKAAAEGAS